MDVICGGGGGGGGGGAELEIRLGRAVTVAKDHNPAAISMHKASHPAARHYTADVFESDSDQKCGGRPIGWFT